MNETQMTEKQEKITSECILDGDNSTLFERNHYIIPLYQRAFAWEDKEISQLIEDINDWESNTLYYYLGSLIVSKDKDGKFEVIDGQQRLTALYLLLNYLGKSFPKESLTYECRDNSNYTLEHLSELLNEAKTELQTNAESGDWSKYGIVSSKCIDGEIFEKLLTEKFQQQNITVKRRNGKIDGQRKHCLCMPAVDIGQYDTCRHGCNYCYARKGSSKSMLDGLNGEVYERKVDLEFEYK